MVFIIVLFSSMMYIVSGMVLGMLRNAWKDDKNMYTLKIIYSAIFTGTCVSRSHLDISSTLYVILFTYIIYEIFLMTTIYKCYIKFSEI